MNLLGIGVPEAGLIFVLALILVGPQRFPEMARQAGRWYRTARTFTDSVMKDVRSAVDEIEDELETEGAVSLQPIRELAGLRGDLIDAIRATAEAATLAAPAAPAVSVAPATPAAPVTPAVPVVPAVPAATDAPSAPAVQPEPSGADDHTGA